SSSSYSSSCCYLTFFPTRRSSDLASLKNCAEFVLSLTAILLAISSAILSADGLAQTQMVLVTTGSTMPQPLYVLWGDEYHKLHPDRKSTRLNSSHQIISYAVFCLK